MKAVILAGGYGTRISEESMFKPKPMIEIGEMPILWHIMKNYSFYGINDFVICAGYKQHIIKEWFANYYIHTSSDITFDLSKDNEFKIHNRKTESWTVTIADTGLDTETGGRIKRIQSYIGNERFMLTYGDAVGDINIDEIRRFHEQHKRIGTMTMYNYGKTKGVVEVGENNIITDFREKSNSDSDLINIGYMVFEPQVFDYIDGEYTIFEKEPLKRLVGERQIVGFVHKGFWQCMDTMREKQKLEKMWEAGDAPWKIWC